MEIKAPRNSWNSIPGMSTNNIQQATNTLKTLQNTGLETLFNKVIRSKTLNKNNKEILDFIKDLGSFEAYKNMPQAALEKLKEIQLFDDREINNLELDKYIPRAQIIKNNAWNQFFRQYRLDLQSLHTLKSFALLKEESIEKNSSRYNGATSVHDIEAGNSIFFAKENGFSTQDLKNYIMGNKNAMYSFKDGIQIRPGKFHLLSIASSPNMPFYKDGFYAIFHENPESYDVKNWKLASLSLVRNPVIEKYGFGRLEPKSGLSI